MTESTLEKETESIQVPDKLVAFVAMVLMLVGVYFAGSLLNWAINHRLANSDVAESSKITAEVRERQLACLARNIYHEAGSEPFEGKVAVAQVTLNRAEARGFPDDICQVIYQKNLVYEKVICQFSWACDRQSTVKPINTANWRESEAVAKKVLLEGFRLPSLQSALYFHADYINPGWNRKKVAHIGRHIFYQ
jgi:spore germination cell wall hydrolase CwlJ-like protein